jgi:hypothetical protein
MNRLARAALSFVAAALMALLLSCGGGRTASGPAPITVVVNPPTSTVYAGESEALSATLDDPSQKGVTWTLAPASGAGTLTQTYRRGRAEREGARAMSSDSAALAVSRFLGTA